MLLDLDSTLFGTYGSQEGEGFNFHYQAHGYHPLLCYDGLTGDLLKAELRDGALHCSNDADKFMEPLFQEYLERGIKTYLRGDSGFSSPKLYKTCEMNGCSYDIRLKQKVLVNKCVGDFKPTRCHPSSPLSLPCHSLPDIGLGTASSSLAANVPLFRNRLLNNALYLFKYAVATPQ